MIVSWHDLIASKNPNPVERLLCLDPGETCGWAFFIRGKLDQHGQLNSLDSPAHGIYELFKGTEPTVVVCEDYRVYAHKLAQHTHSDLFTPRLIGMIEAECERRKLPLYKQMASQAKGFATDSKLREWSMWAVGQKHSRDAIRHGIYFLLFGKT